MQYQDKVKNYYDYTRGLYRVFWHGDTNALHYGIWDASTRTLHDALLNTNEFLAEKASVKSGEKVLDAGCGVGGSAFWLAKNRGAFVAGVTISKRQFAKAKALAVLLGLEKQIEFFLQDYTQTDFPEGSFDVVWAIESVCHAVDKSAFLREAYRLLTPKGRLIIADGFLEREPRNKKEETLLRNFLQGLALDNLAESKKFEGMMHVAGFRNVQNWDKTEAILPTAVALARMSRWSLPLSKVTTWLRLTPQLLVDNNRAGVDQLPLVQNRILTYRIFLAEK